MADNVSVASTPGSGMTVATDEISSVQYQKIKVAWGPPDTASDVTSTQAFPVQLRSAAGSVPDVGSGTGGSYTLRTIIDSSQLASLSSAVQSVAGGVQMVALPTDQTAIPMGQATDRLFSGVTSCTPAFAQLTTSATGNQEVVASVSGKKIRVIAAALYGNASASVQWISSTAAISPLAYVGSNYGYVLPFNPAGWFETASNAGLRINATGSTNIGVHVTYITV